MRLVTPESWQLMDFYHHYRAGFLPLAGGFMNQPWRFLDAMAVIGGEFESGEG